MKISQSKILFYIFKKILIFLIFYFNFRAQQNDPNDHLAYEYAITRQINEAMIHVKIALSLRAEHIPSLHLLALLLTAQKKYTEALHLIDSILQEYPDNLNTLYVKAHLELHSIGGEQTLSLSRSLSRSCSRCHQFFKMKKSR